MEILKITNKDHTYVKVECSAGVAQELYETFAFFTKNYRWSPLFKSGRWDGRIKLYNRKHRTIYRGLLPEVRALAQERGWEIIYEDELYNQEISLTEAARYIDSLDIVLPEDSKVRDDQVMAFVHSIRDRRCVLLSPTGSGKSVIIYMVIRYLLDHGYENILLVVPTVNLVKQMVKDFTSYSGRNGWKTEENCAMIFEGQDINPRTPVTVSTWQSIYELDEKWFERFDTIIGDEVHLFSAASLKAIMGNLINAEYRIGCTGTLDESETNEMVLRGLFGGIRVVTTTKKLMDAGHLSDFNIKCLLLKHPKSVRQLISTMTYQQEIEYLIFNEARNKFIRNLVLSLKGNSLLLFQYVEKHGDILHAMIKKELDSTGSDRKLFYIHGGVDVDIREQVRFIAETETNCIIVASYGTFSTGVNIRNLHNIIFATSGKGRVRNLQSIGRGLRTTSSKTHATLYDIADDLKYGDRENYTLRHFFVRLDLYGTERFKFKIYRIELN